MDNLPVVSNAATSELSIVPANSNCAVSPGSCFFPQSILDNPDYQHYLSKREKLLNIIRKNSAGIAPVVDDIVDLLLDSEIPTGTIGAITTFFKIAKKARKNQKQREAFKKAIIDILEQIFDPTLFYRLTSKDIKDAFCNHGFDREKLTAKQIAHVYTKISMSLKTGIIRDLIFDEGLITYIHLKLEQIKESEQNWKLSEL